MRILDRARFKSYALVMHNVCVTEFPQIHATYVTETLRVSERCRFLLVRWMEDVWMRMDNERGRNCMLCC
jgi:hypothetical protein